MQVEPVSWHVSLYTGHDQGSVPWREVAHQQHTCVLAHLPDACFTCTGLQHREQHWWCQGQGSRLGTTITWGRQVNLCGCSEAIASSHRQGGQAIRCRGA